MMKRPHPIRPRHAANATLAFAVGLALALAQPAAAEWNALSYVEEDVLEFRTDCPDEGEHWSPVWLVVLESSVYMRLGDRAADRVNCNSDNPYVRVRVGGDEYAKIELIHTPDMAEAVAAKLAEKYFWDFLFRRFPHPYTMRLVAAEDAE